MSTWKDAHANRLLSMALCAATALVLMMAIALGMTSQVAYANEGSNVLYRLFQPANGEHHYTVSQEEIDICTSQWGWTFEGEAWECPATSATPVYRLFNRSTGLHHYTVSEEERDICINEWGWAYEGVAWYSDDECRVTVYRLFHPETGLHHYTVSADECNICTSQWGWVPEGTAWYGISAPEGVTTDPAELAFGDEAIMGASSTSVDQMVRRFNAVGHPYPGDVYEQYGAGTIEAFCQILAEEAAVEGVRAEVVFAQAMHETGWLQFGGDVSVGQCNFAGIGATGGGNPGNSFNDWGENSVRKGLRAQVQHLKAYASADGLNNETVDPRYNLVNPHGCAPTVKALSGRWASSSAYGEALIGQIAALLNS